jgi:hypothetical protein
MTNVIVWALLTGLVTGGAWVGIVLGRQRRRLGRFDYREIEDLRRRVAELERGVGDRLSAAEERLDFVERLLPRGPTEP